MSKEWVCRVCHKLIIDGKCNCDPTHGKRVEPSEVDATVAIRALVEALESYTMVHGADEDDEQALALGRAFLAAHPACVMVNL